jgi:DNA polymerase-3 subunit alpha
LPGADRGKYDEAKHTASEYQDIFGKGNFFLEIQDQGLELEKKIHATCSSWRAS